jgi:hypothetical protein
MLVGIAAVHSKSIIHRDIKPDNFLIATGQGGSPTCKVADFGVSDQAKPGQILTLQAGTPAFMAPEQHNKQGYSFPVDAWAAGISLYMLYHQGRHPYVKGQSLDFAGLNQGKKPNAQKTGMRNPFRKADDRGKDIARKLLIADPSRRLTLQQACQDPWFGTTRSCTLDEEPWEVGDRITYASRGNEKVPGEKFPGQVVSCNADGSITIQIDGATEMKVIGPDDAHRLSVEEPTPPGGDYAEGAIPLGGAVCILQLYPVGAHCVYVSRTDGGQYPGQVTSHLADGSLLISLGAGVQKAVMWYDVVLRLRLAKGSEVEGLFEDGFDDAAWLHGSVARFEQKDERNVVYWMQCSCDQPGALRSTEKVRPSTSQRRISRHISSDMQVGQQQQPAMVSRQRSCEVAGNLLLPSAHGQPPAMMPRHVSGESSGAYSQLTSSPHGVPSPHGAPSPANLVPGSRIKYLSRRETRFYSGVLKEVHEDGSATIALDGGDEAKHIAPQDMERISPAEQSVTRPRKVSDIDLGARSAPLSIAIPQTPGYQAAHTPAGYQAAHTPAAYGIMMGHSQTIGNAQSTRVQFAEEDSTLGMMMGHAQTTRPTRHTTSGSEGDALRGSPWEDNSDEDTTSRRNSRAHTTKASLAGAGFGLPDIVVGGNIKYRARADNQLYPGKVLAIHTDGSVDIELTGGGPKKVAIGDRDRILPT